MFRRLRHRLELWLSVKAITTIIHRVDAKTVALLVDDWIDKRFGAEDSELVQREMIDWLDTFSATLGSDQMPPR